MSTLSGLFHLMARRRMVFEQIPSVQRGLSQTGPLKENRVNTFITDKSKYYF